LEVGNIGGFTVVPCSPDKRQDVNRNLVSYPPITAILGQKRKLNENIQSARQSPEWLIRGRIRMCVPFSLPFPFSSLSIRPCPKQLLPYVLGVRAYWGAAVPNVDICCVIRAVSGLSPVLLSEWRWVNGTYWEGGWWF